MNDTKKDPNNNPNKTYNNETVTHNSTDQVIIKYIMNQELNALINYAIDILNHPHNPGIVRKRHNRDRHLAHTVEAAANYDKVERLGLNRRILDQQRLAEPMDENHNLAEPHARGQILRPQAQRGLATRQGIDEASRLEIEGPAG